MKMRSLRIDFPCKPFLKEESYARADLSADNMAYARRFVESPCPRVRARQTAWPRRPPGRPAAPHIRRYHFLAPGWLSVARHPTRDLRPRLDGPHPLPAVGRRRPLPASLAGAARALRLGCRTGLEVAGSGRGHDQGPVGRRGDRAKPCRSWQMRDQAE